MRDAFELQMRKTLTSHSVYVKVSHTSIQSEHTIPDRTDVVHGIRCVITAEGASYRGQQRLHLCALILHVHLLYL